MMGWIHEFNTSASDRAWAQIIDLVSGEKYLPCQYGITVLAGQICIMENHEMGADKWQQPGSGKSGQSEGGLNPCPQK